MDEKQPSAKELEETLVRLLSENPFKFVLSNPKKDAGYRKASVLQKEEGWQAELFTQKQAFHRNFATPEELKEFLSKELTENFKQLNAFGRGMEQQLKQSKKGKLFYTRRASMVERSQELSHNRKKKYLLKEGEAIPPLVDMGIFTKEGKVIQSMYDKYKQINRFLEMVDDAVDRFDKEDISVIDFGCGKSYLTFVLYYYLTELKGMKARVTGLDLKEEVIQNCNRTAEKYGYEGLHFEIGDIKDFDREEPVDMVITLHACDTATDYALYYGVGRKAGMIFSVPCCQHELNGQMESEELALLTRYGIVKERCASLFTDAIRANLLEVCGYRTQLLEFIDLAHTPKNLLIRAVRANVPADTRAKALREVEALCRQMHLDPCLYRLLAGEKGKIEI